MTPGDLVYGMNCHGAHEHLRVSGAFTAFAFFRFRQRFQCSMHKEIASTIVSGVAEDIKETPAQRSITGFRLTRQRYHRLQNVLAVMTKLLNNALVSELALFTGSVQVVHTLTN
jgi:hypothetical protein